MGIYERKIWWKIALIVLAIIIFATSLVYTQFLAKKISNEERKKVELWAEAIQSKNELFSGFQKLFKSLEKEQLYQMELRGTAQEVLTKPDPKQDLTALLEVITKIYESPSKIPNILTNENGVVIGLVNISDTLIKKGDTLTQDVIDNFTQYQPIKNRYWTGDSDFNYIYFKDSETLDELDRISRQLDIFLTEDIINSATVPVLLTDASDSILAFNNIDTVKGESQPKLLAELQKMKSSNKPIKVDLQGNSYNLVYYRDSLLLRLLRYFPFVQFGALGLFVLVGYMAFSNARRSEQNRVWAGMAKETAHQLGTPITSLSAWIELLKQDDQDLAKTAVNEIQKDVDRLELIADRFSKIGSEPDITENNIQEALQNTVSYMMRRSSKNVSILLNIPPDLDPMVNFYPPLFNWVLENLIKNALDAMKGKGTITIDVVQQSLHLIIDVTDTGSGIPKSKFKQVFLPGYSSKKRGWGLGLTLSKRIVENYHSGKIFVAESALNKGSRFRIILPR